VQDASPWLDELTVQVEIAFIVFNPQHGLYSYAGVNFMFNRGGHIYKLINVRSAWAQLLQRSLLKNIVLVVADATWLVMCLYVIVNEFKDIIGVINSSDKRWFVSIAEDYLKFWNLIDWISIMVACTIALLGFQLHMATSSVNGELGQFAEYMTNNAFKHTEAMTYIENFFAAVEDMLSNEQQFRLQLVLYPSVLMLRLFKSFAAQERLAVVTMTFVLAQSDIFHFFIVFFSVYTCMSVNAVLFFGQDVVDFSTWTRSFHSCFLVMFGDWNYDDLTEIGRIKASMYFWMFMVVVVLVLQNIMLAILMDSYGNVKAATADANPIQTQIYTQWRRWKEAKSKTRVRLNDIYDGLLTNLGYSEAGMLASEDVIFPKDILDKVPHLTEKQAKRTMTTALDDHRKKHATEISEQDMQPDLRRMRRRFENIIVCSEFVRHKVADYDRALAGANELPGGMEESEENVFAAETGKEGNSAAVKKEDDMLGKQEKSLRDGIHQVKHIAQQSTSELSESMAAVLAEEMGALEKRQKEQQKSMERMQSSLQELRALAYKLSSTSAEVAQLSGRLAPNQSGYAMQHGSGGEAPEVAVPAGALRFSKSPTVA
jgi:hypothetical protein